MLLARTGPPGCGPTAGRGLPPLAWFCLVCSLAIVGSQAAINRHQHEGDDSALGRSDWPASDHKERARRQIKALIGWPDAPGTSPPGTAPAGLAETTNKVANSESPSSTLDNKTDLSLALKSLPEIKPLPEAPVQSSNESSKEFQARLNTWEGQVTDTLSSQERAFSSVNRKFNRLRTLPKRIDPKRAAPLKGFYPSSGVAKFLDTHPTKRILDPRVYLTSYWPGLATTRIGRLMEREIPARYVYAYTLRTFYEYGQKIASRLIVFESAMLSLLQKKFETINSSPDADDYVFRMLQAFLFNEDTTGRPARKDNSTITSLIGNDKTKDAIFERALNAVGLASAEHLANLRHTAIRVTKSGADSFIRELCNAFKAGVHKMLETIQWQLGWDVVGFMNQITKTVVETLTKNSKPSPPRTGKLEEINGDTVQPYPEILWPQKRSRWQELLFSDLGTAERVVRVFAQMLTLFQEANGGHKSRFIELYLSDVKLSLRSTMSSFIWLQSKAHRDVDSQRELAAADAPSLEADKATVRPSEAQDLSKLAARCYLAGRRWRLLLEKSMRKYKKKDGIINEIAELIKQMKKKANGRTSASSSIEKICLPKLELGVRGWSIEGESEPGPSPTDNQFPLRPPIEELNKEEDPFAAGVRFGFRMGFMVGFNDKLNQTHDMAENHSTLGRPLLVHPDEKLPPKEKEKAYIVRVSYRRGLVAAAREVIEHGTREGYMAALKVTMRAGMLLPLEAGSKLASLQGANFGTIAGRQAGHAFLNKYLSERNIYSQERSQLELIAGAEGAKAGQRMGDVMGAIVGHESALEAYRRTITRGGKLTDAKFHLDEYIAGAKVGFEYGMGKGGSAALAVGPHPLVLNFFRLKKPKFSSKVATAFGLPKASPTSKPEDGLRSGLIELPADLPTTSTKLLDPPSEQQAVDSLSEKVLADMHAARNHTRVMGTLTGSYKVAKEIKKGMQRISLSNLTYNLEVKATGFIMDGTTYLTLKGTINNAPVLHGSLLTRDLAIPK